MPSSHQKQARSPAFHSIRSSAFHRISHRSHAFHRISHQPGWLTSCNTGLKVISAHRNSPAHIIRPLQYLLSYILKILICLHAGNPRVPRRVLAPKPCGGNNAAINVTSEGGGARDRVGTLIRNKNLESNFLTPGIRFQFKVPHLSCTSTKSTKAIKSSQSASYFGIIVSRSISKASFKIR